ncbi:hypothetical protein J2S78_000662 [Salibacterium salarium]|uniref:hypothetical protein n=1 Tax=Salibacterium salarium TaxID=284579 RepID=UPI00277D6123|nr:hypothetical protein [Salibacterium salarium]MDQ0298254.1 hypothetical protein [Salibacterium salarium]
MQEFIESLDLGAKGLWFPVTVCALFALTVIIIPKKNISWREIYITFGVVAFSTWFSDSILARGFDLFDLGDAKKSGLGDILSYTFIPSSLAILYLNYLTQNNKWKLTTIFTLISLIITFGMVYFGYMKWKEWNWFISIIVFLFAFGFALPTHIKFIRNK